MNKIREEFEAWFYSSTMLRFSNEKEAIFRKCKVDSDGEDEYYLLVVRTSWEAWQASRESLVVALPGDITPEYEGDAASSQAEAAYCKGYNQAMTEAEELIESAGIKVVQK